MTPILLSLSVGLTATLISLPAGHRGGVDHRADAASGA